MQNAVFLQAALNGDSDHPAAPRSPVEIAKAARAVADAGAQSVHVHACDGAGVIVRIDGQPQDIVITRADKAVNLYAALLVTFVSTAFFSVDTSPAAAPSSSPSSCSSASSPCSATCSRTLLTAC